jgi:MATE family multidrug resistance protein
VTTGALRGAGDTKTPMYANFIGYWVIGLPLGCVLAFPLGWGALGIWIGLCCGLMIVGSALLYTWHRKRLVSHSRPIPD